MNSCTEISFFFLMYSSIISCLNSSADISQTENVTFLSCSRISRPVSQCGRGFVEKPSLSCWCLSRNADHERWLWIFFFFQADVWLSSSCLRLRWLWCVELPAGINSCIRNDIFLCWFRSEPFAKSSLLLCVKQRWTSSDLKWAHEPVTSTVCVRDGVRLSYLMTFEGRGSLLMARRWGLAAFC